MPCCPGGSCGHLQGELRGPGESGVTARGHDGKRARLGELSVTDERLIFIRFRSVSLINVKRRGSLEKTRGEKEQALKSVLFALLSDY